MITYSLTYFCISKNKYVLKSWRPINRRNSCFWYFLADNNRFKLWFWVKTKMPCTIFHCGSSEIKIVENGCQKIFNRFRHPLNFICHTWIFDILLIITDCSTYFCSNRIDPVANVWRSLNRRNLWFSAVSNRTVAHMKLSQLPPCSVIQGGSIAT